MKNNNVEKSIYSSTKPTYFRRILAFFLDLVLFLVLFTGACILSSSIIGLQDSQNQLNEKYIEHNVYVLNENNEYEFCVDKDGSTTCKIAWENFNKDEVACELYDSIAVKTTYVAALGIFISELILEFFVPVLLKNGRTVGMFCIGLGLIDNRGIKVTTLQLFMRFLFGKFIVVSMLPLFLFMYHFFGLFPGYGLILSLLIIVINALMKLFTPNRIGFVDAIGKTYMVENDQQIYVDTLEELSALKIKELEEKEKQKKPYW